MTEKQMALMNLRQAERSLDAASEHFNKADEYELAHGCLELADEVYALGCTAGKKEE